jgi:hypothetical protein
MNHIVIRTTEDFENGSHDFRKSDFTPLYGLNLTTSRMRKPVFSNAIDNVAYDFVCLYRR